MKKVKLGELAKVIVSGVDKKTKEGETIVKLCNFVDVYYNWAITVEQYDSFMEASARDAEIEKFSIGKGQVAITKDSETRYDIGIPTYIADDFDDVLLGYHCALITPNNELLNGKYLNALLNTDYAKEYFANNATGSGQRYTISEEIIKSFPVPLIPIDEQKKIGNYLSDIDSKLTNNRKQNAILEKMAKQIYDYWFVQFDFPDENGRPYKSSGGKMVWNETLKREIPEGWEVKKIGDICPAEKGSLITKKDATPGHIKVVAAGLDFSYYHNESNRPANTITVSGSGENAGFTRLWREEIFASDCSTIVHNNIVDVYITYYTLKSYGPWLYRIARKSAQPHIYPADVNGLSRIVPPVNVIDKIESNFHSINTQIALLQTESEDLQLLRSYLLPLLMTGQAKL